MDEPSPQLSKLAVVHIGHHELQLALISHIAARAATPAELAAALGVSTSRTRYHLRKLLDWGLVERVGGYSRRGVFEGTYKIAGEHLFDDEELASLSDADQLRLTGAILRLIYEDVISSFRRGLVTRRPERAIIRYPVSLDEEGWAELGRLHVETYHESRRIQERSTERLAETQEEPIVALSAQLLIELPKELDPRPPAKRRAD
jgi:DNA-binding transcriptional ArsR family regulator